LAVVSLRNVLNLDTSVGEVGLVILQYLYYTVYTYSTSSEAAGSVFKYYNL
jgi:hypothetical protein